MSRKALIVTAAVVLLAMAAATAFFVARREAKPEDPFAALRSDKYLEDRKRWKEAIDDLGSQKAYDLFKQETLPKEFGIAHTLSHVFGELLYEKEGLEGIAVCDGSFAFGCYHSFFGKAISEHGIGVVHELDKACSDRWGIDSVACLHGVGHGLLGYLGDEELLTALDVCSTLSYKEPVGGCRGGVFMEFNFHTMQSPDSAVLREYRPEAPYYPCDSIPEESRQACYFEQPQWWLRVFEKDYAKVGGLCQTLPGGPEEKMECFKGIGNIVSPNSSYDAAEAVASCSEMPDAQSKGYCLQGASWSFSSEPTARPRAKEVCAGLAQEERSLCAGWSPER